MKSKINISSRYGNNGTVAVVDKTGRIINNEYEHTHREVTTCDICGLENDLNIYRDLSGTHYCVKCKIKKELADEQAKLGMNDEEFAKYRNEVEVAFNTDNGHNQMKYGVAFNE